MSKVKIVIWDDYLKSSRTDDEPKVFATTSEKNIEMGTLVKIKGITFGVAGEAPKKRMVMVSPISGVTETQDNIYCTDKITCPHCNTQISDSWEMGDDGTEVCDYCGTEYDFTRKVEVSYSTYVKHRGKPTVEIEVDDV